MKKFLKLSAILLVALFTLTGCVVNSEVQVNKDGSADITYLIAFKPEEISQIEQTGYTKSQFIEEESYDEATGVEIKRYNENGLEGNIYKQHYKDITKVDLKQAIRAGKVITPYDNNEEYQNIEEPDLDIFPPQFTVTEGFFAKKIVLNANLDLSAANYESYGAEQNYSLKINTKGSIRNTNATKKTGNSAEWQLNFDEYDANNPNSANPLKATIYFYNYVAIFGVIIGAIIIIGGIGFGIWFVTKKGKGTVTDK